MSLDNTVGQEVSNTSLLSKVKNYVTVGLVALSLSGCASERYSRRVPRNTYF